MDRFQKELNDCSKLAQDAKRADDREFWQQAAERWKALLDGDKPPIANALELKRVARFNRRRAEPPRTFSFRTGTGRSRPD